MNYHCLKILLTKMTPRIIKGAVSGNDKDIHLSASPSIYQRLILSDRFVNKLNAVARINQ
jgi:hypothetical protein